MSQESKASLGCFAFSFLRQLNIGHFILTFAVEIKQNDQYSVDAKKEKAKPPKDALLSCDTNLILLAVKIRYVI